MRKLLFLLLFTVYGFGQTLPSPAYNQTTTNTLKIKTPATVTSVNFLSTVELDGSVAKIAPANLGFLKTVDLNLDNTLAGGNTSTRNFKLSADATNYSTFNYEGIIGQTASIPFYYKGDGFNLPSGTDTYLIGNPFGESIEVTNTVDKRNRLYFSKSTTGLVNWHFPDYSTGDYFLASNVDIANTKTNSVTKISQNQSTWNNKLMILCGDSTTWQMTGTGLGFDYMTAFYRAPGNKMENITGYLNFGSSGYTLNAFYNGAVATPPVVNTATNAGIGNWDYYGHNNAMAVSQRTAIEYRKSIPNQEVVWVLCLGINDCILNASVGNLTQAQITDYIANLLNQALLKFKQEFPKDQVILRVPNTMAARPYNAGAGFPSPTEYPTFGANKPADVALVTKWNTALRNAYLLVSQQNLNTILIDMPEKVFGSLSAEIDANFRPFMTDLVHPNGLGYNAISDELAYAFTDERKQRNFSRIDEAVRRSVLLSNQPYENYADYVSNETLYKLVLNSKLSANAGASFIDVPFTKTQFDAVVGGLPFYIKKGNVTLKFTSYSTNVQGAICRLLGITVSSDFQSAIGSTSVYIDQTSDANNLHKTGNETKTGTLTFSSSGATNANALIGTANGSNPTIAPIVINLPSTSGGSGAYYTQAGALGSKAIFVSNTSTLGAESISATLSGTGIGFAVNSLTGATGKTITIQKQGVTTWELDSDGIQYLKATPVVASGNYDILVRRNTADANIGRTETIPSSSVVLSSSIMSGSATLDFPSTAAGTSSDLTITVTGATDGDVVSLGVPNVSVVANTSFSAWVSSTNTVTVRHNNYSSGASDPASGTFKVKVFK